MHPAHKTFPQQQFVTRASQLESIVIESVIHATQTMTQRADKRTCSLSSYLSQRQQNHPHGIRSPSSLPLK
jgi:hypothetical protein